MPNRVRRAAHRSDPLGGTHVDQSTESRIRRASGGVALPDTLRRAAERESGRDLGGVRVHMGGAAADLNERVQATAFTVGRNIFLGGDAARPGSASGNRLLAHEVGHVVEEGGGATVGRVRRRVDLRPLEVGGAPTVRRLFGSGKKKRQKEEDRQAALTATIQANAEREAENHPHFAPLKSAVAKVEQCVKRLSTDPQYDLATYGPIIINWSREIAAQFDGAEGDPGFGPLKARLRIAADDVQILFDRESVAESKRRAEEIYMRDGYSGNLKALTASMRSEEFSPRSRVVTTRGKGPESDKMTQAAKRQAAGEALGLTKAEQTAITVFTAQDYKYINPATANSRSWMLANRKKQERVHEGGAKTTNTHVVSQFEDQYVANRTEEGSLHAGMAMQGLAKMEVFVGPTYRGESFNEADFKKKFKMDRNGKLTARQATITRTAISSASKDRAVAERFATFSSGDLKLPNARKEAFLLLWEFDIKNGRDIEALSASPDEKEVATLPGATFKIATITRMAPATGEFKGYENVWVVKAVQIK